MINTSWSLHLVQELLCLLEKITTKKDGYPRVFFMWCFLRRCVGCLDYFGVYNLKSLYHGKIIINVSFK